MKTEEKNKKPNPNTESDLSVEDLKKIIKLKGNKLGFLLASASFSEETKNEIISLLDKMSLEQIERLISVLEAKFLNQATSKIDEDFKNKLQTAVEKYKIEDEKRKTEFEKFINTILN